jgi:hypothetical protein
LFKIPYYDLETLSLMGVAEMTPRCRCLIVVRLDKFEGQDLYVLSRGDGTFAVWNYDSGPLGAIDGSGNVKFKRTRQGDNQFPLSVGRSSTLRLDNPAGKYRVQLTFMVKGIEEVHTGAGTFTSFTVTSSGSGTFYSGEPYTLIGADYYAPAAKAWVKSSFSTNQGYDYSEELASYQVLP